MIMNLRQLFVSSMLFLACLAFVSSAALAQRMGNTGGNNGSGNDTAGGGTDAAGGGEGALGFDAGVTLERTERTTRDTSRFVGAQAPTTGDFGAVNQPDAAGNAANRFSQQNPLFNFFNQVNQLGRFNNQANQRNQIRVPLRLGFAKPQTPATSPAVATRVTSSLESQFAGIPMFNRPIEVIMDGNTAVLVGSVTDDEARRIAERLVLLEPGVYAVRNELELVSASELLPPPDAATP